MLCGSKSRPRSLAAPPSEDVPCTPHHEQAGVRTYSGPVSPPVHNLATSRLEPRAEHNRSLFTFALPAAQWLTRSIRGRRVSRRRRTRLGGGDRDESGGRSGGAAALSQCYVEYATRAVAPPQLRR